MWVWSIKIQINKLSFTANTYEGKLQIITFAYKQMQDMDNDDIRRMRELYDCSCEVHTITVHVLINYTSEEFFLYKTVQHFTLEMKY